MKKTVRKTSRHSSVVAKLTKGTLKFGQTALLTDVPTTVTTVVDPLGTGVFLHAHADKAQARLVLPFGKLAGLKRFTCCFRYDPFWNTPRSGTRISEVPVETQYLMAELDNGQCAVFLPLLAEPFRAALEGNQEEQLCLVAETGDPAKVGVEVTGLFVAVGADPYALMESAARSIVARMKTGRLRRDKPVPDFVDYFGWCTWDSFYREVTHDKVRLGLRSFADGGVQPRVLILDDGWLSTRRVDGTEADVLTAFSADPVKFPGDLAPTVRMAKEEFDVSCFLVWHAMGGYWAGTDRQAFPQYRIYDQLRSYSEGILHNCPGGNGMFGNYSGVIAPEDVHRFFQHFYRHLRLQGVDGVKVDNQAALEGVSREVGGRVTLMRTYREAMEGAAQTHFTGRLINCMCHSTDVIYGALASTVARSFTDFWPNDPASHGLHMYANAQNTFWMGEFIHPDWDMFQSGHAMGPYHAASRAVSGGPIYVSDKPDGHNFDVLRKLVLSDGTTLRCRHVGRPTRDCLFHNTTQEDMLLKIFNLNLGAGVIGVFNTRFHKEPAEQITLSGTVSPADVIGIEGDRFAVFAHTTQELTLCRRTDTLPVSLKELSFELFTIVPIEDDLAPVGLTDKFNSAGAITAKGPHLRGGYGLHLRDGGRFMAWCRRKPRQVLVDEKSKPFRFDRKSGTLAVTIPANGPHDVRILV